MKRWMRSDEWVQFASCGGDSRFTTEPRSNEDSPWAPAPLLDPDNIQEVRDICNGCNVRPECIKYALDHEMSSVWVAGEYLPDPAFKRELRSVHERLRGSLPDEFARRGDNI